MEGLKLRLSECLDECPDIVVALAKLCVLRATAWKDMHNYSQATGQLHKAAAYYHSVQMFTEVNQVQNDIAKLASLMDGNAQAPNSPNDNLGGIPLPYVPSSASSVSG